MKFSSAFLFTSALIANLTAGEAALAQTPPPGSFSIDRYAFFGDGCRPGSVATNVSPDNQALTLIFDNFIVESSATARQAKKSCELDLKLKIPSGWAVAFLTADVRGYAALSDAMSFGVVNSVYAMKNARQPTSIMRQKFVGPYDGNYQLRNQLTTGTVNWSACGKTRMVRLRSTIRTRLSPRAQSSGAMMTVDSVDGEVTTKYGLVWKRCARDDAEEGNNSSGFPNMGGASWTGVCKAILKDRTGATVDLYEGSAVGSDERAALRAAEADARQQCRADRRSTPGTVCELVAGSCTSVQD